MPKIRAKHISRIKQRLERMRTEILKGNGWLMAIPAKALKNANGEWDQSRIGVLAKVVRQYDSRVKHKLMLEWCTLLTVDEMVVLPHKSNKGQIREVFKKLKGTGQFKDDFKARIGQLNRDNWERLNN